MLVILSFLNGLYHGLGADHLMAITALANRGGNRREVSLMGLRFGLGHMGILLLLGVAGLLWNFTASAAWESRAEMLGGGLLILLGLWTLLEWLKGVGYIHSHGHIHEHSDHTHSHLHFHFKAGHPNEHVHPHLSALLGALFALSGLRSLLLSAFPVLQARSMGWALLYILVFGTGIVISMTAYGFIAGSALSKARSRSGITLLLSATSITLGVYWIWLS